MLFRSTGPKFTHTDNKRNECFRKYSRAEESFYDHSDFLKSVSRYSFLFSLNSTDYKAWAHGLKKAGYATNPDYPNMLIRTIEENNLIRVQAVIPVGQPWARFERFLGFSYEGTMRKFAQDGSDRAMWARVV